MTWGSADDRLLLQLAGDDAEKTEGALSVARLEIESALSDAGYVLPLAYEAGVTPEQQAQAGAVLDEIAEGLAAAWLDDTVKGSRGRSESETRLGEKAQQTLKSLRSRALILPAAQKAAAPAFQVSGEDQWPVTRELHARAEAIYQ